MSIRFGKYCGKFGLSALVTVAGLALLCKSAPETTAPPPPSSPTTTVSTRDKTPPESKPAEKQPEKTAEVKKEEAKQPEAANRDTKPADTKNPEPAKKEEANPFPLIRNVKVESDPLIPYSARISWEVDPKSDTAIYVGRYDRPLSTRELVLDAENLTSPPLDAKTTSFFDRNIPDGSYYYVVVTAVEMSRKSKIVLKADANYSTKPLVIYRDRKPEAVETAEKKPAATEDPARAKVFRVRDLTAVNAANSVKLNWGPPEQSKNVRYTIYKSYQPLNTPQGVEAMRKIGEVGGDLLSYEDTSPVADRLTYYGVATTDLSDTYEYRQFVDKDSFIAHTYRRSQMTVDTGRLLPDALTARLVNANTVKLYWADPDEAISALKIYRSERPITDAGALLRATAVGEVPPGGRSFTDPGLRAGAYYYAVIPRDKKNQEQRVFEEGRTFTGVAVYIDAADVPVADTTKKPETNSAEKKGEEKLPVATDTTPVKKIEEPPPRTPKEPIIEFLEAEGAGDTVELRWSVVQREKDATLQKPYRQRLYRSTKPLQSAGDLRRRGELVAEPTPTEVSYEDVGLEPGRYYYALVLEVDGAVQRKMLPGRNYLRKPVVLKLDEAEAESEGEDAVPVELGDGSLDALNRILAQTFYRGRYEAAIRRILPFAERPQQDPRVQAKALLYTGLSHYRLGRYRTGLEYFVEPAVQKEYPDRARFWYNRTIEVLR